MRKYQIIAELIKAEYPNAKDISGNTDANIEHGYKVDTYTVQRSAFGPRELCIHIYPYVKWTDGSYRPCYGGGWSATKNNVRFYCPQGDGYEI